VTLKKLRVAAEAGAIAALHAFVKYGAIIESFRSADAIFGDRRSHEIEHVDKATREPPMFHRRLGRQDHHG